MLRLNLVMILKYGRKLIGKGLKTLYLNGVRTYSSFRDSLTQLFNDQQFVMKISEQTRIYPDYFDTNLINQFTKDQKIQQYKRCVQWQKIASVQKPGRNKQSQQLFSLFPHYRKYLPLLDCYIDFLATRKLVKNSNQYYKNKCAMEMFDMRNPQNWFTSNKGRHFIYHHGPTNSGKTSFAIKQLKQLNKDKKGIYMAPLRLLAWQMQQKLQNCNLITGQDKEYRVSNLTSCTIQAMNFNQEYDVAVIDEIQMIGDKERGWSWTKAVLGTRAKRIHLCGDERAISLVSKLVQQCGGTLEERRYSRLGKLKLIPKKFDIENIEQGDCMIDFSVDALHKLRRNIKEVLERKQTEEEFSGKRTHQENVQVTNSQDYYKQVIKSSKIAMVYGRLPPECRKQQARKFNTKIAPYLVATNAIGMGLNLNIKKIIFAGIRRRNFKGQQIELQQHEIQQIAGRAGRGLNDGLVQCASHDILKKVRKALRNVNKTYGINLEDEQSNEDNKLLQITDDEEQQKNKQNLLQTSTQQHYDLLLKRVLTQKQRNIKKAGLFIQHVFLKRMIFFLEQHYSKKISLSRSAKYYLKLALKSQEMYFLSQKLQLLEWLKKLQDNFAFQKRDIFEVAKGLSMHYNSSFAKEIMMMFASEFLTKKRVNIPKRRIESRNNKKIPNNFLKLDILQTNYSILEIYINLWNRYQFIFWDIQEAKRLKQQTSQLIKQVLEDQEGFVFNRKYQKKPKTATSTFDDPHKEQWDSNLLFRLANQ